MQMICILLGVPESERHWLFEAIEPQFDFGGSRKASVGQMSAEEAGTRMYTYGQELIASKRAAPTDDMLSVVANATVDSRWRCPNSSCTCSSACCSVPVRRRRATRSRAGCWRLPSTPTRWRCCVPTCRCCRRPSRRWCAGRRRRRRSGAPRRATSSWAAARSRPGRRCRSGRVRPTATRGIRRRPTFRRRPEAQPALGFRSGHPLLPRRQPGPAGAAGAVRGAARAVLVGHGGQAGRVDPQQQAHRHPAPGRRTGSVKPDAFAAVMATGIVSIAAADHGYRVVSDRAGGGRGGVVGGLGDWPPSRSCVRDFDDHRRAAAAVRPLWPPARWSVPDWGRRRLRTRRSGSPPRWRGWALRC